MGNSTEQADVPLFRVDNGPTIREIEEAIYAAKDKARRGGASVKICELETDEIVASVWPDGKVDVTFHGCRYVTTFETRGRARLMRGRK